MAVLGDAEGETARGRVEIVGSAIGRLDGRAETVGQGDLRHFGVPIWVPEHALRRDLVQWPTRP
jgi:hypothetical protein